jgi:hypothetical protein
MNWRVAQSKSNSHLHFRGWPDGWPTFTFFVKVGTTDSESLVFDS